MLHLLGLLPTVTFLRRAVRTKRVKRLAYLGLLGQEGGESEEVVFEMVFLKPKGVFDTRLECWRLKHSGCLTAALGAVLTKSQPRRLQCST